MDDKERNLYFKNWTDAQIEHFEERCAIMEYEANLPAKDAKRLAYTDTKRYYGV